MKLGKVLLAGVFGMLCAQAAASVTPISPVVEDPATGIQYQLLSNADWTNSQAEAKALGGNLVTLSNQEQQDFVFDLFGAYGGVQRILWTGLYDPTQDQNGGSHASNFVWVSGAPDNYTNWDAGEPNDTSNAEFRVSMYHPNYHNPGSWNDWSNRTADPIGIPFFGVVEFVPTPEPVSLVLFGIVAAMLLLTRRHSTSTEIQRRFFSQH